MKIEALEPIKSHGRVQETGDIVTVPDDIGAAWCAAGWARDMDGVVSTGERITLDARLTAHSGVIGHVAEEVTHG